RALLAVTGQHKDGFRDHVIFSLALGTGLREHEIVALDVGDVFDDGGKARRRIQLRVFKRSSDETEGQEVVLPDGVRAKLDKLYGRKRRGGDSLAPDAPVFVSRKGNRLSTRQLRHAFKVWQERAGFERSFNFHAMRHTACSNLYRRTRDIRLTQRFARHRSILTTSIYAHPSDEDLVRSVRDLPC
ncbi:MAG: tyrosine-type recombinase/integrase, partial [Myxococcales bacterium]|nr:tyrosine-type recombinase/integrase [Myxococcales bacterium]